MKHTHNSTARGDPEDKRTTSRNGTNDIASAAPSVKATQDTKSKKPPTAATEPLEQPPESDGMQLFKISYLQKVLESNDRQKQRVKGLKERVAELEAALNASEDRVADLERELDHKDQAIEQLTSAIKLVHVSLCRKDGGETPLYDTEKDKLYEALCSTMKLDSDEKPSKRESALKDNEEMTDG